jgi:two-component system sensor histidine kinase KdpD
MLMKDRGLTKDTGPRALRLAIALALVAVATLAAWAMDGSYTLASQAMVYLLAVVAAAFYLEIVESLVVSIVAVSVLDFLFVPPRYTFAFEGPEYLLDLISVLVVSLVVSGLAARSRAQTRMATLRAERADAVYALAEVLAGAATEDDILRAGRDAVVKAAGMPVSLLTADAGGSLVPVNGKPAGLNAEAARWVVENQITIGPMTGNWPDLTAWYVPLPGAVKALGLMVVDIAGQENAKTDEDLRHIVTLSRQTGIALQRARLAGAARSG